MHEMFYLVQNIFKKPFGTHFESSDLGSFTIYTQVTSLKHWVEHNLNLNPFKLKSIYSAYNNLENTIFYYYTILKKKTA